MGAMTLKDALDSLNPKNDYDWTDDGLPRMAAVETLMDDESITRKDVTAADPEFCRQTQVERVAAKEIAAGPNVEVKQDKAEAKIEKERHGVQKKYQTQTKGQIDPEEVLRAEIVAVGEAIEELAAEAADISRLSDNLKRHQAQLQAKTMKQHSPKADMKARMIFIKSQSEQRAKRYEKGRRVIAAIGKDGLNPMSRLDQAMRRKTARGTRRPPPRIPGQE